MWFLFFRQNQKQKKFEIIWRSNWKLSSLLSTQFLWHWCHDSQTSWASWCWVWVDAKVITKIIQCGISRDPKFNLYPLTNTKQQLNTGKQTHCRSNVELRSVSNCFSSHVLAQEIYIVLCVLSWLVGLQYFDSKK